MISSQVSTNGIISFGLPFYIHQPFLFPSPFTIISSQYLVAPFWSDVDIRTEGTISYEVHSIGNDASEAILSTVSGFISNYTGDSFNGSWLLVALWDSVHEFPATDPAVSLTLIFILSCVYIIVYNFHHLDQYLPRSRNN